MDRYDIVIIGSGPAGISAAITAKIRGKNILLLGEEKLSPKMRSAALIRNYPGCPDITGKQLAALYREQLKQLEIPVQAEKAVMVYSMGSRFSIQTTARMLESRAVILANGVFTAKTFPGETEYLGRGVSYCATCDAPLCRGRKVVVLGYGEESENEANFLSEVAAAVSYIPVKGETSRLNEKIRVIRSRPEAIEGAMKVTGLRCEDGFYEADHIFILRESVAAQYLVPGLETDGAFVKVDRQMRTNIAGCFACGDLTGKPYQLIKSAGEGNIAALSAVSYLAE